MCMGVASLYPLPVADRICNDYLGNSMMMCGERLSSIAKRTREIRYETPSSSSFGMPAVEMNYELENIERAQKVCLLVVVVH